MDTKSVLMETLLMEMDETRIVLLREAGLALMGIEILLIHEQSFEEMELTMELMSEMTVIK